jgi:hypothetical protein
MSCKFIFGRPCSNATPLDRIWTDSEPGSIFLRGNSRECDITTVIGAVQRSCLFANTDVAPARYSEVV